MNQHIQLGGFDANGQPKYVDVDESYFFNWKYHRGRRIRSMWVVGLLERGIWCCWLEVVARRNARAGTNFKYSRASRKLLSQMGGLAMTM